MAGKRPGCVPPLVPRERPGVCRGLRVCGFGCRELSQGKEGFWLFVRARTRGIHEFVRVEGFVRLDMFSRDVAQSLMRRVQASRGKGARIDMS